MKISELIKQLEEAKKENGDIDVCCFSNLDEFFGDFEEYDGFTVAPCDCSGKKCININPKEVY